MFQLDDGQAAKLAEWVRSQDGKVAERQGRSSPNYGASGGAYTYSFTPTSLGCVVVVRNGVTGESVNLTDYDSW